MTWNDVWTDTVGGRSVKVQRNDVGDTRVLTIVQSGSEIEVRPAEDESLTEALMNEGGFTEDQAADIVSHT